jgi:hypothetical protein
MSCLERRRIHLLVPEDLAEHMVHAACQSVARCYLTRRSLGRPLYPQARRSKLDSAWRRASYQALPQPSFLPVVPLLLHKSLLIIILPARALNCSGTHAIASHRKLLSEVWTGFGSYTVSTASRPVISLSSSMQTRNTILWLADRLQFITRGLRV